MSAPHDQDPVQAPDEAPAPHVDEEPLLLAFASEGECRSYLARRSPEDRLEAFVHTDPLRLAQRVAKYLWAEGLLMEPDRVVHRAMARAAVAADDLTPHTPFEDWILECIEFAAKSLVYEDLERIVENGDKLEPWAAANPFIRDALGLSSAVAIRVCTEFNALPRRERQAFFALVMDKRPVEECLEAGFGPPEWLRAACLRGLDTLLGLELDDEADEDDEFEDMDNYGF